MGETFFWGKRKCHWRREIRTASNKQNWRKHSRNSSNFAWKLSAVRSKAEQVNIDRETVRKILTEDIDVRKCVQKWSQRSSLKNKNKEVTIYQDLLKGKMTFWVVSSQVMKHGSTDTTLKRRGNVHNGRLPIPHDQKIFRRSKSRVKTMLLTFFDIRGIVHYEFVPTGQTVNQVY